MPSVAVTIVSAKNLDSEDIGRNYPYVEAWFDEKYKQHTPVIKNSSSPEWNETLVFNLGQGSRNQYLYLKVLDKDLIHSDKIGEGELDIKPLLIGDVGLIKEEVNLPARFGSGSRGTVSVIVKFA
ncbi:unnamed protein product [Cunninghamella echinulata]